MLVNAKDQPSDKMADQKVLLTHVCRNKRPLPAEGDTGEPSQASGGSLGQPTYFGYTEALLLQKTNLQLSHQHRERIRTSRSHPKLTEDAQAAATGTSAFLIHTPTK